MTTNHARWIWAGFAAGYHWARLALLALFAASIATAAQAADPAEDMFKPAAAEPGTAIPAASVQFGMRPYADNTFYIIGIRKGWFKDVNITIEPQPEGLKVTDTNVTALLLNGQLDLISEYCPLMLPLYKTTRLLKCIAFTNNSIGETILANPKLKLKSFKDYMKESKDFKTALHDALAPLQGKTLVGAPELSDRPFEELSSQMSGITWKLQIMEDSKSLVLAKSDQIDFINPEGTPIVYLLEQAGWTDLLDNGDVVEHGPAGVDSPVERLVGIVGMGANANFVNAHPNTVLRFLSVVWRIMDEMKKDPSLFDIQAPYLNSVAGTNFDGRGVAEVVNALDPFAPFEYGKIFYEDPKSARYYQNLYTAIIDDYVAHNIIPKGAVTPDQFIWGAPVWKQAMDYKTKTDALIAGLQGKTLSADKQAQLDKARQLYDWYDYLDAFRLATAAAAS
jgi:hypothetical protein